MSFSTLRLLQLSHFTLSSPLHGFIFLLYTVPMPELPFLLLILQQPCLQKSQHPSDSFLSEIATASAPLNTSPAAVVSTAFTGTTGIIFETDLSGDKLLIHPLLLLYFPLLFCEVLLQPFQPKRS